MKLNHEEVLYFIGCGVLQTMFFASDEAMTGKFELNVSTKGDVQEFSIIVYELSFYADYRYLWE